MHHVALVYRRFLPTHTTAIKIIRLKTDHSLRCYSLGSIITSVMNLESLSMLNSFEFLYYLYYTLCVHSRVHLFILILNPRKIKFFFRVSPATGSWAFIMSVYQGESCRASDNCNVSLRGLTCICQSAPYTV